MVLEVKDLQKSFSRGFIPRKQKVLKGVSFNLAPGTITGFLGANGAGKTTTMKCVLGLARPDFGGIGFFGSQPLSLAVKNRIGFLPERPYFYEYLTGEEFLRFYGKLSLKLSRRDLEARISELLELVGLVEARHRRLRAYSKGMLQKIGFAQAIIHRPDLVILDEPVSGLDPDGRAAIAELIRAIAKQGASVFFSSHLMHDAERLCERLVILKDGAVMFQGATSEFLDRMGVSMEVSALVSGREQSFAGLTPDQSQAKIGELVRDGARILEVRRHRKSLEEAFIETALRGGGR
jgi:ABC-2 type transport system ATP-binding protein